ncbi:hypothetical protein GCM10023205_54070 [Yinghuangia aomiensis]|uniref:Uncharacterized protein n=2 Tax=Yinghuangia aomiensis TaxID=676205 RepID=A0ABP9HUC4_9ACTN
MTADLQLTSSWLNKEETKSGVRVGWITFTIKNNGPYTVSASTLEATAQGDGVKFLGLDQLQMATQRDGVKTLGADKCKKAEIREAGRTFGCEPPALNWGDSLQVTAKVALTGTSHTVGSRVELKGFSLIEGNPKNNSATAAMPDQVESGSRPPAPAPKAPKQPAAPKPAKPPKKPTPKPSCGRAAIEYSKDNGKTWTRSALLGGFPGKLKVRVPGNVTKGCQYKVSLASYSTQGPTWKTSGTQAFLGMDTVTLTSAKPTGVLDISKHLPKCYGQVDLYGNDTKFDGKKNPLPKYPSIKYPTNLIAGWNGGTACAPKTPKPPATPSVSPSVTSPTPTPPASVTPPPTTPTPTPTKTPSTPPASPSPSASSPAPPTAEQTAPQAPAAQDDGQQTVTDQDANAPGSLAHTGASSRLPYLVALAVFSLLLGALALWWTRGHRDHSQTAS